MAKQVLKQQFQRRACAPPQPFGIVKLSYKHCFSGEQMQIIIACDHGGLSLKQGIADYLKGTAHTLEDLG
ncbi:MAG: hypothetical protein PHG96_09835, partial [Kiritimatiellae bacterium]|nr:hypothetical protein [Kiritimatiellia bacterium]